GFYDRTELWRPLAAFVGLLIAVPPLLFGGMPFRDRLLWFSAAYPFVAYWLLTGVELAEGPLRLAIGVLLLLIAAVPLALKASPSREKLLVVSFVAPSLAVLTFFAFGRQPIAGFDPLVVRDRISAAEAAADSSLTKGQVIDRVGGPLEQFFSGDLYLLGLGLSPFWWLVFALLFAYGLRGVLRHATGRSGEAEWRSRRPFVFLAGALAALLLFSGGDTGPDGIFL